MKSAKFILVSAALLMMVSCGNTLPTASPTPHMPSRLDIFHSKDTTPLVILASDYAQDPSARIVTHEINHSQLVDQLLDDTIPSFVTHHPYIDIAVDGTAWTIPLAQDGLVIIVHPDNPVNDLSIEQVQRIYRGFISNWQGVGGDDTPIHVYSREAGAALRLEFDRLVMGQQQTTPNAQVLSSTDLVLARIKHDVQAIGYIPLSLIRDDVQAMTIDDIMPNLTSITAYQYPLRMTVVAVGVHDLSAPYETFFRSIQRPDLQALLSPRYAPLPR